MKITYPRTPSGILKLLTTLLVIATVGAWLFEDNAQTCLSRDFVIGDPGGICWRKINDYENVIAVSDQVYTVLSRLMLMSAAAFLSLRFVRKGMTEVKYWFITGFLVAACICSLIFVLTVAKVFDSTEYNNNNYALNNAYHWAHHLGKPLVIIFFTGAIVFVTNRLKRPKWLR